MTLLMIAIAGFLVGGVVSMIRLKRFVPAVVLAALAAMALTGAVMWAQ